MNINSKWLKDSYIFVYYKISKYILTLICVVKENLQTYKAF